MGTGNIIIPKKDDIRIPISNMENLYWKKKRSSRMYSRGH